jgi:hypothetical protein
MTGVNSIVRPQRLLLGAWGVTAHAGVIGVDMGIEARTHAWGVTVGMVGIVVSLRVVSVAWQMRWVLCPVFVRLVGLRGGERSDNYVSQRVCCLREEEWKCHAEKSNFKSSAVFCVDYPARFVGMVTAILRR